MTNAQSTTIDILKAQFMQSCLKYNSYSAENSCKFDLYKSNNDEDKNITIIYTVVSGLSDDYQPFYQTVNMLVEPDGNAINLMDFYPQNFVIDYINKLKKI